MRRGSCRASQAAPLLAERSKEGLILFVAGPRSVFDLEVVFERFQPDLVALPIANARIESAARVPAELRRPAGSIGKCLPDRRRTKESAQTTQLIVDQRIHWIEQ
jgi:hypothetical protein